MRLSVDCCGRVAGAAAGGEPDRVGDPGAGRAGGNRRYRHADDLARLKPAMVMNVAINLGTPLLVALGLFLA